jgi:hypothetical protein
MTKNEFISKQAEWKRYRFKIGCIYGAGLGLFMLWSFLLSGMKDLHGTSPLFRVCGFIYFCGGVLLFLWLNVRRMKQLGAICPNCKKPLFFNAILTKNVIATGKCGRCGETIIND